MNATRRLILNADDFGLSEGINRGILETHRTGIVTSASLMVRQPAAEEAAKLAFQVPEMSIGLHIDLGEWIYRDEEWKLLYQVVNLDDQMAIEREILDQLDRFRTLMGRNPTHLDSHQHVHRRELFRSIALRLSHSMNIPLRGESDAITFVGDFYGQDGTGVSFPELLSADRLINLITNVSAGVTEIGCHPGFAQGLESVYATEREREMSALCDPGVRESIKSSGVRLCSYRSYNS